MILWWFSSLKYEFTKDSITVCLPWNKSFVFDKKDIASIDKINTISILDIGYRTNLIDQEVYALTSDREVYKIVLKD